MLERSNIAVGVGQTVRIDMVLQPGQQTQTVTVTSEAPTVNTTDVTLGGTISNQAINDLPLNGRDFKSLLTLRPGVSTFQGDTGVDAWAANGTRAEDVGYMVDGLRVDEAYTGNSAINSPITSGDAGTIFPVDGIQEVNTESNPKAEFGWRPGVIINMGLKSGSNTLHGTGFALGQDTPLNARNFFDVAVPTPTSLALPKAPVAFEQFGGNMGGAIKKDKLFWFADFEGQTYSVGTTSPLTTPLTVLLPGGNTASNVANSLVNACLAVGAAKISALSAQIAGINPTTCAVAPPNYTPGPSESFYPTNAGPSTTVFLGLVSEAYTYNGIGKLDYHINPQNTINGEYFYGYGVTNFAGSVGLPGTNTSPFDSGTGPITVQLYMGAWTWVPSSTRVNELRVGYDRFYQPYYGVDLHTNPLSYGINTGVTNPLIFGFPGMSISGFTDSFGGGQHKIIGPDGSLQLLDHYTILHGNHTFKFGGEFIDNKANSYQNASGKGSFSFSNLESFLEGSVANSGNKILAGNPQYALTNYEYALFAQDDWRVSRRITMNLGLRWEYSSPITAANDLLGNFSPTVGLQQVGKGISTPYNGDFKNFEPRFGVAWDVNGNGRTVLRAGGSLMYELLPMQTFVGDGQVMGLTQVPTGATIITKATGPAGVPGIGNMGVITVNVPGSSLTPTWQAQTPACIAAAETGGTVTCPTIFPASVYNIECGDGIGTDPLPCSTMSINPNFTNGYVTYWTLGIQRALTNQLTLDASYVGTYGGNLPEIVDINQAKPGSGFTAAQIAAGDPSVASSTLEQQSRPLYSQFPYLSYINELKNLARSNYNALQATLTERNWHGLTFLAGYTYSHSLDDLTSTTFMATPVDSTNPQLQYGNGDFDIRHRVTLSTSYAVPGKKSPGQLLEGWQMNSVITLQTPLPWTANDTTATDDFEGTGEISNLYPYGQYWNFSGNPNDFDHPSPNGSYPCWKGSSTKVQVNGTGAGCTITTQPQQCLSAASKIGQTAVDALNAVGCFVVGNSVLIPPALGTDGDAGRGTFRGPHFRDWDISAFKTWKFKERLNAEFRAEFFNILNHPNFFNLNSIGKAGDLFDYPTKANFGCSCITPDQTGNLVVGSGGARKIQLGLRLNF